MTGQRPGEAEAHKALHDRYGIGPCVLGGNCPIAGDLDAAYPIIAAAVAEQIAQRIKPWERIDTANPYVGRHRAAAG